MPGGQLLSAVTWTLVSHGAVQVPTAGSSTGGGWTRPGRVGDSPHEPGAGAAVPAGPVGLHPPVGGGGGHPQVHGAAPVDAGGGGVAPDPVPDLRSGVRHLPARGARKGVLVDQPLRGVGCRRGGGDGRAGRRACGHRSAGSSAVGPATVRRAGGQAECTRGGRSAASSCRRVTSPMAVASLPRRSGPSRTSPSPARAGLLGEADGPRQGQLGAVVGDAPAGPGAEHLVDLAAA